MAWVLWRLFQTLNFTTQELVQPTHLPVRALMVNNTHSTQMSHHTSVNFLYDGSDATNVVGTIIGEEIIAQRVKIMTNVLWIRFTKN